MNEAFEIGDDVLRLLERADRPPASASDRVWDSIEATLDGPAAVAPPPPAPPSVPARAAPGKLLLATLPLLLLAGTVGFWVVRSEQDKVGAHKRVTTGVIAPKGGAVQRTTLEPPGPSELGPESGLGPSAGLGLGPETNPERLPAAGGDQPEQPEPASAEAAPDTPSPRKPDPKAETSAESKPKPSALGLEDELALMAEAREALHGGKHKKALRLLAEHASSFKNGVFAEERDFSRVVAACELEDVTKAKGFAKQYRRAHPKGALGAKLGETCAGAD